MYRNKDEIKEVWKVIKGYETLYEVSNKGDIRSLDKLIEHPITKTFLRRGRILKKEKMRDGYERVTLCKDGVTERFQVHRIVAESFLENKDNMPFVNHIDEIRDNNDVNNLEWCECQYNLEYSLARYYKVTSPEGVVYRLFNLSRFCKENNLHLGAMSEMTTGRVRKDGRSKRTHHKGWLCEYLDGNAVRGVNKHEC